MGDKLTMLLCHADDAMLAQKLNMEISTTKTQRIWKLRKRIPVMTCTAETQADTAKSKRMARTNEMRLLRAITGDASRDQKKRSEIRKEYQTEDVVGWARTRRRFWNEHVSRMANDRLAKIAKNGNPASRRPVG
ncbi:hypothetical protein Trydic_g9432 [Trypoxylus dichotomus]